MPMPNLPADPFTMQRYLDRGFTLVAPIFEVPPEPEPEPSEEEVLQQLIEEEEAQESAVDNYAGEEAE